MYEDAYYFMDVVQFHYYQTREIKGEGNKWEEKHGGYRRRRMNDNTARMEEDSRDKKNNYRRIRIRGKFYTQNPFRLCSLAIRLHYVCALRLKPTSPTEASSLTETRKTFLTNLAYL